MKSSPNQPNRPPTKLPPRRFVDEGEAALWTLKAEQGKTSTYRRPRLWSTAENKQSLEWIGPEDEYGVTKEVQVARAGHADEYTAFIRAGACGVWCVLGVWCGGC